MSRRALTVPGLVLLMALALAAVGCGSGSSSTAGSASSSAPPSATAAPGGPGGESSPGASIEHFGAAAGAAEKSVVATAAHSFFAAMASDDYPRLCAGLAATNRAQLRAFLKAQGRSGGCAAILKTLITPGAATEARQAANAAITTVRIRGTTAFVLFRPKGGVPSYFVMKQESGAWKSTSLGSGAPIDPTATP